MAIIGYSPMGLQNNLNVLKTYCNTWALEVNIQKTKIMVFRRRGPLLFNEVWHYDNLQIDVVNDFNYLGTCFNYTGTFVLNQEILAGKGLKALNVLFHNVKKFKLQPNILCQLFDTFVGSIIECGCEICGFTKISKYFKIYKIF